MNLDFERDVECPFCQCSLASLSECIMYYDDHNSPHFHAEYQGSNALFDFKGNVLRGDLKSPEMR